MAFPPENGKTRKDSAACVSLSSYALVKEHDGKTVVWAPGFGLAPAQPRLPPKRFRLTSCILRAEENFSAASGGTALVPVYIGGAS
jgi:hypothetical protein